MRQMFRAAADEDGCVSEQIMMQLHYSTHNGLKGLLWHKYDHNDMFKDTSACSSPQSG